MKPETRADSLGPLFEGPKIGPDAAGFLKRPLVFIDLEATGLDPARDRIIDICLVRLFPDGKEDKLAFLINPGIPIPPESTAIHGIKDEDVRAAPFFKAVAGQIDEFLKDADLAGYNLSRFDIPLLAKELERTGLSLRPETRRVIDAMKIFHKKESRDLAAAYQFYCRKRLEGHHGAQIDAVASKEILFAQLDSYPDLKRDLDFLHSYCNSQDSRFVDGEGKFIWRYGAAFFNFGKHKGRPLEEVARGDRDYIAWLMNGETTSPELAAICRNALDGEFPRKQESGRPEVGR
ncbi:MAG: 3'-5' exonuclease [Elusimicrobia bacterium]|nr:3'-5' exonuclease [Elusimicrobiota bacterium]